MTSIPSTLTAKWDVGLDTITLVATDGSGNTSTCQSILTIQDVTAPSITCGITTQYLDANGQLPLPEKQSPFSEKMAGFCCQVPAGPRLCLLEHRA